jgi:hypothetical protein
MEIGQNKDFCYRNGLWGWETMELAQDRSGISGVEPWVS